VRLQISPQKFLRWFSQKSCLPVDSASNKNKLKNFRPYRMNILHELLSVDAPQMIRLCNLMLKD
jgi:hypothetical protein